MDAKEKAAYQTAHRQRWQCSNCREYAAHGEEVAVVGDEVWCYGCLEHNRWVREDGPYQSVVRGELGTCMYCHEFIDDSVQTYVVTSNGKSHIMCWITIYRCQLQSVINYIVEREQELSKGGQ